MSRTDESRCRWRNVNHATDTALLQHVFFSFLNQFPFHSKRSLKERLRHSSAQSPIMHLGSPVPFISCDAVYACVAPFALKIPLKLSRYCRKTRIHNTQATRAGAMVSGDIVR